jgi:hypothetical protein
MFLPLLKAHRIINCILIINSRVPERKKLVPVRTSILPPFLNHLLNILGREFRKNTKDFNTHAIIYPDTKTLKYSLRKSDLATILLKITAYEPTNP